ncbi:MAG: hypothetical protein HQL18_03560, partial [Candidatus Omnitrophica bacterium]|nr:hypothetical protein [Candidatus Omnitrophota bacterium]
MSLSDFWQCVFRVCQETGVAPDAAMRERVQGFTELYRKLSDQDKGSLQDIPARLSRSIHELRYALGAARMVREGQYCIPKDTEEPGVIQLEDAWNPVAGDVGTMDKMSVTLKRGKNCLGLTGPNEIGKSTLIELIALCVLYFQMGLPLPARAACMGVFKNIYTIVPGPEGTEPGESTHTWLI